jgi:hypothetical protein
VCGALRPCPRRTKVVVSVPKRGGDEERRLLPDFEVLRTTASITILPELPRTSDLETKSSSCDGEVTSGVPLWLLGQPDIDPS